MAGSGVENWQRTGADRVAVRDQPSAISHQESQSLYRRATQLRNPLVKSKKPKPDFLCDLGDKTFDFTDG